jgi:superfamily II DNA or RNA helicase
MSSDPLLAPGAYARILDEELKDLIAHSPGLQPTLRKLEEEEEPEQFNLLLGQVFLEALRQCKSATRANLLNSLIELLGAQEGLDYLVRKRILHPLKMLTSVHREVPAGQPWPLPQTALNMSFLFTGAAGTPTLEHELTKEMRSADRLDLLVSFIKLSGLRLLMPALQELTKRQVPVRVITTSYMGASDPEAIEWLVQCPNVRLKVSYDTERTRLHAKAYHFYRQSVFSTAYIGSANLTRVAITSGLEWTVKITEQDQPAVMQQFRGEFEGYWSSEAFETCQKADLEKFRRAICGARAKEKEAGIRFFAEITPRPFQERILEKLRAEREVHKSYRNLIVAATGTGKTVISALDYKDFCGTKLPRPKLLFLAHRVEILEQACDCFRTVLRDYNFGDILGGVHEPAATDHLFCTIASANSRSLVRGLPKDYYEYIVVDEAHHGAAPSYQPLYEHFTPQIWLGLTATPERMDGKSILPEYNYRIAAEIRLPEALEERLLCPFHYFGITDPVSLDDDKFWRNGQYRVDALTNIYTGDDIRAWQRVEALFSAFEEYKLFGDRTRAIGFCASVKHAHYMKDVFLERGIQADTLLGETEGNRRSEVVQAFRNGEIQALFTVDVLNEGFDLPEINLVMFLRPTDSLTIFLQQLGRGLRHAPDKDCLTVIDLVGQQHRSCRIDRKFAALLPRQRMRIDEEAEHDFPHLPPGCNIYIQPVARRQILQHIRQTLQDIQRFTLESLATMSAQRGRTPSFEEFIHETQVDPIELLRKDTWSAWKARAGLQPPTKDPDQSDLHKAMVRLATRNSPTLLENVRREAQFALGESATVYQPPKPAEAIMLHYLLRNRPALARSEPEKTLHLLQNNPNMARDIDEIAAWRQHVSDIVPFRPELPFDCPLDLHAAYGYEEIKAALGVATMETAGPTGTGVIHAKHLRAYLHFVTFNKSEKDFSTTNRYQDYLLNRTQLHWESMSTTTQESATGQNYIHFAERGYTILFFARLNKKDGRIICPFIYLGPASALLRYEGNRPIRMIWELKHPLPAEMYELNGRGG